MLPSPSTTSMRFTFKADVPLDEAKNTLSLAGLAVESLFGRERVELETSVAIDRSRRQFTFDISRRLGRTLALIFAGFIRREFGADMVVVEHLLVKPQLAAGA
jgi:hypothetical protein